MPYALVVGLVAVGIGSVPVAFGLPWWAALLAAAALLYAILRLFGRAPRPAAAGAPG